MAVTLANGEPRERRVKVTLVPEALAEHWQKTLDFLVILREHWPKILAEEGRMDGAARRVAALRALAAAWKRQPPSGSVYAAGSTGSIPATAELMATIARLPNGAVILPGLDLMKASLNARTAGLPLAEGRFAREPDNTADAIESGCLLAQAGAIERMFESLEPGAICIVSGGAAARVADCLRIPLRRVENLVLEGLARIALERASGASA